MKKIIITAMFIPSLTSATQDVTPEALAALHFNQWYISQIIAGKAPLTDYPALSRYITRETIGKLKAMNKLDPNKNDLPDADMFIKAQGYEDDWKTVNVVAQDYDAACMQVYVSFGKKKDHTVIDCMVKEDGTWKVQSVANQGIPDNVISE
ncbi:DUF3828 domain-containing protein [Enterobacter sp. RHBSTW-00901]|uniref:DUF3828 domain-containing protein n=1 Tax=Enterobacter sp. RHBSTW-00901 TaxID=2742669 RepID=UPI0015F4ACEA|nr:DUF3828 domain-containing protein [Enterobacter sp. RHBSTW-00901]MBA7854358.1 DUF3828 domain-containing protein [Enterobacter sp. RHBSTW-00901]